jgi:crotonobetainyl-CoA:carnitine CoA-transferase CaiB-like acyl-CoA transferase
MLRQALEGVKVAEFTWYVVGPLTTRYLADYGATVIHVESATRLDGTRVTPPFKGNKANPNKALLFAQFNANKYGVTLNLGHPKAKGIVERIVEWADILAESMTPGVIERLGYGYQDVKKIKPDIIYISMSNHGRGGPWSPQPGLGYHLTSLTGLTHITGWPDREPAGAPGAYTDVIAPRFASLIVLAALDYRRRTGKGQYIDLSQNEASLHVISPLILDQVVNGRECNRMGNRHPAAAPHGVYKCLGQERWVAIAVCSDDEWMSFCRVLGTPEWTKGEKFATLMGRKSHEEELDQSIEEWTLSHTAEEVTEKMQEAGVSAGVVQNGEDLYKDPQLAHRKMFVPLYHPEIGYHNYKTFSFGMSVTPAQIRMAAPMLGEHNEYVSTKILGISDEEFCQLMSEAVFD